MFETWGNSEIPLPKELAPNGEKLWSYVHVQLQVPWFYVEVEHRDEDLKWASTYFLSSVAQLQGLVTDSAIVITAVHVVMPKHLNQSDCWQMQRLKRIMRGRRKTPEGTQQISIYVLYDERQVYDPALQSHEKLEHIELLFEFPASPSD